MDATGQNFSTSIPLEQALNPNGRIILATHMNGEVLPKDHGYPLRVIVPGAPAVRSVKWLRKLFYILLSLFNTKAEKVCSKPILDYSSFSQTYILSKYKAF